MLSVIRRSAWFIDNYIFSLIIIGSVSWTTWAGELPADAVYVGDDLDGHALYVGRTYFNGALLPGKAKPNENRVIIGYNGVEYGDSQFQLLSGKNLTWQYVSYGHVPCNAVLGGRTADGKNLYIARFSVRGILLPGRVEPDLHNAFVSFGGKEYQSSFYDVLVEKK